MKSIKITVSVNDNDLTREYSFSPETADINWGARILDMLDTIENSDKGNF